MKASLRITLLGAFAWVLMVLSPYSTPPAQAVAPEIHLNSSSIQVVHNTPANNDVLNMSLNVTNKGDLGSCEGEVDDLLEAGVHVSVSRYSCLVYFLICLGGCPAFDFDAQINYVEHEIGSASYGTSFAPNAGGSVASKIVALASPPNTCGTWSINVQGTGQNLSGITGTSVSLFLNDSDSDGDGDLAAVCIDVNANVGNGIVKPHHGVRKARH